MSNNSILSVKDTRTTEVVTLSRTANAIHLSRTPKDSVGRCTVYLFDDGDNSTMPNVNGIVSFVHFPSGMLDEIWENMVTQYTAKKMEVLINA